MATQKQIQANRVNAQLSTGPRTEQGKAVSRMNALKSGIDARNEAAAGEDPALLAALTAEYDRESQPVGLVERVLVDILLRNRFSRNGKPGNWVCFAKPAEGGRAAHSHRPSRRGPHPGETFS